MLTCKQATQLLSQRQDRQLGFAERLGLRMHLTLCAGCRNFDRQMGFLRRACRSHPAISNAEPQDSDKV
ncbi:MAG: zf-HC2 domain-containing protein [Gammaproteobacteria bacterium]|nr:zf-HC2 domain-containing protein [Gammaproteobacteria bacterium]MBU1654821.1 zf-HC2 domain-containing protein [Gammaproteobacteria bacterium]MBU1961088.1 zf-HC2 domain-containing protein [Gammaproteobacteria bacterium]